jgi:hypothetical protein
VRQLTHEDGVAMRRALPALLGSVALAACVGGTASPTASAIPNGSTIQAEVATYQVVANRPARLLVALVTTDQRWLSFGTVQFSFAYAGDGSDATPAEVTMADVAAHFLPIPESPVDTGQAPTITFPSDGHGVYAADPVTFPRAGFWQVLAHGQMADGTSFGAVSVLQALDAPTALSVGDRVPASDNAVIGDPDVANVALDSRASGDNPIPDPELHQVSIADALAAHRPALVVFSTPVYCVSQFCGPVTDLVAELATDYADRADFIHVEIYRDFEAQELNSAVVDWLVGADGNFREPWTFLIGADGTIIGSWDTVVTRGEIEPLLEALPTS